MSAAAARARRGLKSGVDERLRVARGVEIRIMLPLLALDKYGTFGSNRVTSQGQPLELPVASQWLACC